MEVITFLGLSIVSFLEGAFVLILAWPLTSFILLLFFYFVRRTSRSRMVIAKPSSEELSEIPEHPGKFSSPQPIGTAFGHKRNRSLGYASKEQPPPRLSRAESVSKLA